MLPRPQQLLPAVFAAGLAVGSVATAADPFTIAVIGDQQWPSRTLAIYPSFTVQTDWLAANAQAENLRFVTQVGDIIEGTTTDQWNRAEAAMATLDSATNADGGTGVPWNVNFGNHEVNWGAPGDDPAGADADEYRQYFGSAGGTHRYAGQIEFGGVSSNDLNTWHVIKSSNAVDAREYLMLNLEYDVPGHAPGSTPDPSEVPAFDAIAWAWGILEQHPGMPTIVTTHIFEGTAFGPPNNPGTAGPGRNSQLEIFDKLVKDNPQIFMVLSGHTSQDTHQVKLNASGLKVLQMVTDYTKWLPNGGNGYMRLVEIDEDTGEVRVKTYTPGIPSYDPPTPAGYRTDANGEFTVSMDWATRFPAPVGPIMGAPTVDAITDDGATIEARLTNEDADAVTLVWAYADQGASDIISWTSAPGGGSHAFGSALENDVLSRVLSGLDGDTEYRVRFLATAGAESDWSSAGGFITGLGGSPAPANFAGTAGTIANGTKVDLAWTDGFATESGFVIRRSDDPAFGSFQEFSVGSGETGYTDETTDPNTTYYYRIAAVGSTGTGVFTANLEVTTGNAGAGPIAGLIGHWKLDETSGTSAADSSVFLNDATSAGEATWEPTGKAAGASINPDFTVATSTDLQLSGAQAVTLSAWVKRSGTGNELIAGIDQYSGGDDMYALKTVSDAILWYIDGVGTTTSTDTLANYAAATADGWVHVVGVYEPGVNSRLYINGVLDNGTGSGGGGIAASTAPFCIGRYHNSTTSGDWNGQIDDVQVYSEALALADVAVLFNNPGSPLLEAGSTVTMGTPSANAITADGATLQCQLLNANADDVTLVWAFADQEETTLGDWTTAPGGGSHSFGASTQGDVLSHALSGLAGSTGYSFRFLATAGADSDWSEAGSFTTGQTTLPAPVGFSGTPGTTATTTKVDLSWTDGFTTETGFVIRRSTDPGFAVYDEFSASADDIAYEDDTTDPNTSYFYRIATMNAVGTGAFSANIEVTTGSNPSPGGGPVESLVGHWKFDDGSGSTAIDSSGNGNDATNAGGGSWVAGKAGGAYDQPRFTVGDSSAVQFVGAVGFTVSLWVKQHVVGNHMLAGIDGFSTGGSDDMYSLKTVSDKVRWYLKGVTAGVDSTDTLTNYAAATADGWVHVVGVYEPGVSSRLYINGALDNTGSGGGAISNFPDPFGLGRYYNNLSGVLNGALDDVQVYDQALSDADVAFLHANPGSPLAAPAPTFADWIDGFGLDPADKDFGDDVDGDKLANGVEAWFGTHPGQFNVGLSQLSTDGTTTTFEHPQNDDPPSDLAGFYEWSPNLNDWYASGSGPGGGPTVSFVPNTVGTTTTVTATASEALDKLFLRVGVMQN